MKKYTPLIFAEVYLLITLIAFFFGPIEFKIHNVGLFIFTILLYHSFFILGYVINAGAKSSQETLHHVFSGKQFYLLLFFGIFTSLIAYKNVMQSNSIIPYNIIAEIKRGISEPGIVYAERMQSISDDAPSRILNIAALFFSFSKLLFVFYFTYFWKSLNSIKKTLAIIYPFVFIAPGVASGTNSFLFIFSIFSISSLLCILYTKQSRHLRKLILFSAILMTIPIYYFGVAMSQRGGGFEYFANTSPLGDISTRVTTPSSYSESSFDFVFYTITWLDYYITQGYYGFSLILNLDHDWTFGFGNSAFLQRQFEMLTGYNISGLTFQSKISHLWDKDAQWHSFYSQFANDFGIAGLCFFMLFIGYYLSATWKSITIRNSFYGAALLPVFMIMIIFMPANNQIFGYIDTFSYFIVISIFWLAEGKKIKERNV